MLQQKKPKLLLRLRRRKRKEAMEVREAMATLDQNQKFLWMDQMGGILIYLI